jgi:DNA-binding response OmpR family regulator
MNSGRFTGRRILLVDDDPDILESMELAISAEGAEVVTAADGNTAVSMFNAQSPDAVVLDMMLPKRSGFLVLEKIRESENPPPVVMITANQGRRHMQYAKGLGVAAYLVKPVSLTRLLDTVEEAISGKV